MIRTRDAFAIGLGMLMIGLFGGLILSKNKMNTVTTVAKTTNDIESNETIQRVVRTAETESNPRFERLAIETSSGFYLDTDKAAKDFVDVSARGIGAILGAAQTLANAAPSADDIASFCDAGCRLRVRLAIAKAERDPLYKAARAKRNVFSRTSDGYRAYRAATTKFMTAQAEVTRLEKELRLLTRQLRPARPTTMVAKAHRPELRRLTLRLADIHDDAAAEPGVAAEANRQLSALRTLVGSPSPSRPVAEPKMTKVQRRALNLGLCALRAKEIWEKSAVEVDNNAVGAPGGHIAHSVTMHAVVDITYYCDVETGKITGGVYYALNHPDISQLWECKVTPTRSCGERRDWKGYPFYSINASAAELRGDDDDIRAPEEVVRGK
ncbi:MAG: hypothetical protein HYY51_01285 [Candidatus Magasanikbacteria bacterium]|nr:hypothetical protein [Candidatus Magasanikbacteria bacterium]